MIKFIPGLLKIEPFVIYMYEYYVIYSSLSKAAFKYPC